MPGILASASTVTSESILTTAGDLLSWVLTQATAIISWCLGNPYMIILMVMFIAGFAVSMLARIVYSL